MPGIFAPSAPPQLGGSFVPSKKQPSIFDAYGGSIPQTGSDYDEIMGNYRKLLGSPPSAPITAPTVNARTTSYAQSPDVKEATGNLSSLALTGGYSPEDVNNIRERGISPIRSVYANAQRNLDRNRVLQGNYSPGYAAATAKMAREMSDTISNQVTNVNAGLAQNIAQNKLQAAPMFGNIAESEAARAANIGQGNTAATNQAGEFNASNALNTARTNKDIEQQNFERKNRAIQGMHSIYGTTPALANTFGNQALQRQQLGEQQRQYNGNIASRNGLGLIGAAMGRF